MRYEPATSFRRAADLCPIQTSPGSGPLPLAPIDKWDLLRELTVAQTPLGVNDRQLTVLQALLSFHPDAKLDPNQTDLVVFPSNAAICARLNGMPVSTMRRHLSGLVRSGLIARRDSPNGKRFMRRYRQDSEAFGFDLRPLLLRQPEIFALAEDARAEQEALERLRRSVSLMRRDLAAMATYGAEIAPEGLWTPYTDRAALTQRALRRKLNLADLQDIADELHELLVELRRKIDGLTSDLSINDAQSEHHHQRSNKEDPDINGGNNYANACTSSTAATDSENQALVSHDAPRTETAAQSPTLPLALVLTVCTELQLYASDPIRTWHDFVRTACIVSPMMGITPHAWEKTCKTMGPEGAAITLAALLQNMPRIANPGGYLTALTRKAADGTFSPNAMIHTLLRHQE